MPTSNSAADGSTNFRVNGNLDFLVSVVPDQEKANEWFSNEELKRKVEGQVAIAEAKADKPNSPAHNAWVVTQAEAALWRIVMSSSLPNAGNSQSDIVQTVLIGKIPL